MRKLSLPLFTVLMAIGSVAAEAHVKWFFDYDVTKPPTPIGEVIDGTFVKLFLVSVAGCYLFFLADRKRRSATLEKPDNTASRPAKLRPKAWYS